MKNIFSNLGLVSALCLPGLTARMQAEGGNKLSFFIVGDAHVGWNNKMQPSLDQQQQAMRNVLSSFPGIDLFIDAGDSTYPDGDNATTKAFDEMRKRWMSVEPNACEGIPFLYTAGNHEIMHWREADPETQCGTLGSTPCKPYYSLTRKGIHRQLFGYGYRVRGESGFKVAPGALSLEFNGKDGILVSPDFSRSIGYYHAVPGKPYCATVELTAPAAGGTLELSLIAGPATAAADPSRDIAVEKFPLKAGRGTYAIRGLMKTSGKTIYTDPQSDMLPTIVAQAAMKGVSSVTVHSFVIARADAAAGGAPALTIGGTPFIAKGASGGLWSAELGGALQGARTVVGTLTGGCSSWLIAKRDIDWQVRNAAVTDNGKSLAIESLRNPWGGDEVLIAPLFTVAEPYLARTSGIRSMEVFPINRGNKMLRINVREAAGTASLVIKSATKPKSVTGAVSWDYRSGSVHASVNAPSVIVIE